MEKTITTITDKWSGLKWYERKFYATCLFIYLLFIGAQVLDHLQIGSKFLEIIPLLLALVLMFYLRFLKYLVKIFPFDIPYANLPKSEVDWSSFRGYISLPFFILYIIQTGNKHFLNWAPLWVKLVFTIGLLTLIIYLAVFSKPNQALNLTAQEARALDTNRTINAFAIVFIVVVIFIGLSAFYNLQK